MYRFRSFGRNIFVCVTLIGVKSKYGSGWGTSPGLINNNDTPKKSLCKEHKLLYVYMVRIRKQAHKNFIFLSISNLVLNCRLNYTWLILFIFCL